MRIHPQLKVAHVGDVPTFASLVPHILLDRDHWREQLPGAELLLIEPTITGGPPPGDPTGEAIAARADDVPVVLFAPTTTLLEAAYLDDVDVVVTDDPETAEVATDRVGRARVLLVDPAVDPALFNPVGWQREPEGGVLIVLGRAPTDEDLPAVLQQLDAARLPVTILPSRRAAAADLPAAAVERLVEPVTSPAGMAAVVRGHRVVVAQPGFHRSESAFLHHVLAAAACGTPVVTPGSPRLTELVPPALLPTVAEGELAAAASPLVTSADRRERASVPLRRHVLSHRSVAATLDRVLARLGLATSRLATISVLLATKRPEQLEHAASSVGRQLYPAKQLIAVLHGGGFSDELVDGARRSVDLPVTVVRAPGEWTLGDCLNAGLGTATGELVAKMDDDDLYGPAHLTDLAVALDYSGADVVGKWANFVHLADTDVTICRQLAREERFVTHLPGATVLLRRTLLDELGWPSVPRGVDSALWARCHETGRRLYATHRFNFMRVRHGDHTWQRTEQEFLAGAEGPTWEGCASEQMLL